MQIQQSFNKGTAVMIERLKRFVNGMGRMKTQGFSHLEVGHNTVEMSRLCFFGVYS